MGSTTAEGFLPFGCQEPAAGGVGRGVQDLNDPFADHYSRLTALARRVLGRADEAEEVAADALARLSGSSVEARQPEDVAAWLNRVTVNLALNRLRSRQRHDARVAAVGPTLGPPSPETPEEAVARADERDRVRAVLAGLPDRQATALLLRHAGQSYAEIAAALGVAEGSVGVLLARGERAFRHAWETTDD